MTDADTSQKRITVLYECSLRKISQTCRKYYAFKRKKINIQGMANIRWKPETVCSLRGRWVDKRKEKYKMWNALCVISPHVLTMFLFALLHNPRLYWCSFFRPSSCLLEGSSFDKGFSFRYVALNNYGRKRKLK